MWAPNSERFQASVLELEWVGEVDWNGRRERAVWRLHPFARIVLFFECSHVLYVHQGQEWCSKSIDTWHQLCKARLVTQLGATAAADHISFVKENSLASVHGRQSLDVRSQLL